MPTFRAILLSCTHPRRTIILASNTDNRASAKLRPAGKRFVLIATTVMAALGTSSAYAADVPLGAITDSITPFSVPSPIQFSSLRWSAGVVNGTPYRWIGYLAFYSDPNGTNVIATSSSIALPGYGCNGDCGTLSFSTVISFAVNTTYYAQFVRTAAAAGESPQFVIGLHPFSIGYIGNNPPYDSNSVFYDTSDIQAMPPQTGTITISSNLSDAMFSLNPPVAGAPIGGPYPRSIQNVPSGQYTITFNTIAGYKTPVLSAQNLSAGASITFTGNYVPIPHVIVVPGIGASALSDVSSTDQWLSCASIMTLHSGLFLPVQYDASGNERTPLHAKGEFLAQNDTLDGAVEPSNTTLLDCQNEDLYAVAADSGAPGWKLKPLADGLFYGGLAGRITAQFFVRNGSDGTFQQFDSLVLRLYAEGYDPVVWPYDFRRDVKGLADDLYEKIIQISADGQPINIVAHSMGSLVTAALIKYHPEVYNSGTLQTVVSMGAPFKGGLTTYLDAQGWKQFVPFVGAADTKLMGSNWTSVYELLPQWNVLTPPSGLPPSNDQLFRGLADSKFPALSRVDQSVNPRVDPLPAAYTLWSDIASLGSLDRWHAIIGSGFRTDATIALSEVNTTDICPGIEHENGDGEVPLRSSESGSIVRPSNRIYVNRKHPELPGDSDVIDGIIKIFQGASPFVGGALQPQPYAIPLIDYIVVNGCSPIDLIVTNAAGETVGTQAVQISGAEYARPGGSTQIDVPAGDGYTVQVTGTGLGKFELVFRIVNASQQPSQTDVIPGIAAPSSLNTYNINFSAGAISSVALAATFSSTLADVANALALGLIDNKGIANSLSQKLLAAQSTLNPTRTNILNAFMNEVTAQAGKHITGVAPQVLINDANSLQAQ